MLEYIAVYVVRICPPRPFLGIYRAENSAAIRPGSMLQAQGRAGTRSAGHVGPLSAAPSQCRARIFCGLVARLSRVPVVGRNFGPAPHGVTHKFFFLCCLHFAASVTGCQVKGGPRPPVRCVFDRSRAWVRPLPAVRPRACCSCVGIWGAWPLVWLRLRSPVR